MSRRALAALALLAACGEAEEISVSGVGRSAAYDLSVFRSGSVAAEVHNAPLPGMTVEDAAALVDLPDAVPEDLDLPYVAPGAWARSEHGKLVRLAMLFDPMQQVSPASVCAASEPMTGDSSRSDGFSALAVLCLRDQPLAEGRVDALAAGELSEDFVRRGVASLLRAMFGDAQG